MNNLSLGAFWIGLAALAGALYLLQRLRVRYREHVVVTTLFWKQAVEEARARVLVRRFKHLFAYLFVLAIAALMWLGFADPQRGDTGGTQHIALLDGSAGMGRGDHFARTVAALEARLADLPRARRQVVLCADRPRTVLLPGEHIAALTARLEGFVPTASSPSIDATLRALTGERPTVFTLAGDASVAAATEAALPAQCSVVRLPPPAPADAERSRDNGGIQRLGAGRPASGDWEKVDVRCEIDSPAAPTVTATLGGNDVLKFAQRVRTGEQTTLVFHDLPANGGLLEVRLDSSDALAADNRATLRLPLRRRIRVQLDPALQDSCGAVLSRDPAVLLTNDAPEVAVRMAGGGGATIPTLEFVATDAQREAILLYHDAAQSSHDVLLDSLRTLGLSEVDAMEAATRGGREIAIGAAPGPRRGIGVWAALLSQPFNLRQSRSFPVFLAQSVRWLARLDSQPPFVGTGEPLAALTERMSAADGTVHDPLGAPFAAPAAGVYRGTGGIVVAASLHGPAISRPGGADNPTVEEFAADAETDLALWLAVAVLMLLLIEWFLYRTGRMP